MNIINKILQKFRSPKYRELQIGEKIKPGDEYTNWCQVGWEVITKEHLDWYKDVLKGDVVQDNSVRIRRKIETNNR
jgi:hypothetical protein